MDKLPSFVDMALSPEDRKDMAAAIPMDSPQPVYPYGLCISLTQDELEKLNLEDDCEPGDMLHMHCLTKVTSVSKNDTTEGTRMRVELQITAISAESEDEENEEAEDQSRKVSYGKFYK